MNDRLGRVMPRIIAAAGAALVVYQWAVARPLWARPKDSHHRLDDRSAVRWLKARERPGETWITTRLAAPAVWWGASGDRPILEARPAEAAIPASSRAMVFLGFRFDDVPTDFDEVLLAALSEVGQITAYRGFADASRVAIVDRRLSS